MCTVLRTQKVQSSLSRAVRLQTQTKLKQQHEDKIMRRHLRREKFRRLCRVLHLRSLRTKWTNDERPVRKEHWEHGSLSLFPALRIAGRGVACTIV